jgi:hypothetical protein
MSASFIGELDGNLYFRLDDQNYRGHPITSWMEVTGLKLQILTITTSATVPDTPSRPCILHMPTPLILPIPWAVYDGTDLNLVESPAGYNYNTFFADNMDGAFVSYYDQSLVLISVLIMTVRS